MCCTDHLPYSIFKADGLLALVCYSISFFSFFGQIIIVHCGGVRYDVSVCLYLVQNQFKACRLSVFSNIYHFLMMRTYKTLSSGCFELHSTILLMSSSLCLVEHPDSCALVSCCPLPSPHHAFSVFPACAWLLQSPSPLSLFLSLLQL